MPNAILRETSATAKNTEQYIFKAKPVNQKIMQSVGDLGVPRVTPRPTTATKEFQLSSSRPQSARRKVEAADELSRPLYSSFGSKTAVPPRPVACKTKAAVTRQQAPARSTKLTAPAPAPTARDAVSAPVLEEPTKPIATPVVEAPTETVATPVVEAPTEPVATPVVETTAELIVEAAEDEQWELLPDSKQIACGKRRTWGKDALPTYMAHEADDDDDDDDDYAPTPRESKSKKTSATEQFLASPAGRKALADGRKALDAMSHLLVDAASVVAKAEELTAALVPPTILDASMAAYAEHSGTTPPKAIDIA